MRAPRSRRALLTTLPLISVACAGCFDGRPTSAGDDTNANVVASDEYDCDDVERPSTEPLEERDERTLEPVDYPDPPGDLLETVDQFVREFEEAYRRNGFLEEYGAAMRSFDFQYRTTRVKAAESAPDRDAALVAVVYDLSIETVQDDQREWDTRVVYYVDDTVVLRARYRGIDAGGQPEFRPDPRHAGTAVDCLE